MKHGEKSILINLFTNSKYGNILYIMQNGYKFIRKVIFQKNYEEKKLQDQNYKKS